MANNKIVKDLTNGRLLFYCNNVLSATCNRTGWHNGSDIDGSGACKGFKIDFDRNNGWFIFNIIETNDTQTTCGYISKYVEYAPPIPDGAVAEWHCDDGSGLTVTEKIANYNATIIHSGVTWVDGLKNKALDFNGSTSLPSLKTVEATSFYNPFTPTSLTLSAILKIRTPPRDIFGIGTYRILAGSFNTDFLIHHWGLYVLSNFAGAIATPAFYLTTENGTFAAHGAVDMMDGNYHHILGIYGGNMMKLYLDKVLIKTTLSVTGTITDTLSPILFGRRPDQTDPILDGILEEIYVYDKVLTIDEINNLYANAFTPVVHTEGFENSLPYSSTANTAIIDSDETANHIQFKIDGATVGFIDAIGTHDGASY